MELFNENFFWIFITASLIALPSALLGSFLILRKMSMIGDAISHAVLPGIVIAYLFTQSFDSFWMLLGASLMGIIATFLIETFNKVGRLQEDASIGVTYTWLFALGVVLISWFNDNIDLDQECVLFGEIAYVPLNMIEITGDFWVPKGFLYALFMCMVVVLFIVIFYKGLQITSFDRSYAMAIGIPVVFINYLLMSMVSFTTVFSFDAVGAILVLALMVVPAATGYLLTHKLRKMLILSSIFGISGVFFGYILAYKMNGSIAGAIASILGVQFAIVFIINKIMLGQKAVR
jgi:manganese/zinc/iron transport system permease protein